VEVMSGEALTTSEIEGEILNRDSVRSSIQRQLGMAADKRGITPAEQGIAEMIVDLYRSFSASFERDAVWLAPDGDFWQTRPHRHRQIPHEPGADAIISGPIGAPKIHFEAPPSKQVPSEMKQFIAWFNRTAPQAVESLPALTRAGIAHLYFESIHPFEDGNGRIGRAVAEKAMAQNFGQPILVALATTILAHQKGYYESLERANQQNDVTE
jgi:Fic family protein